jgi:4-hydroxy-tetrahydrodipicolinate reductase
MPNKGPLRIALIGHGKMGHAVEIVAHDRGHSISAIVSRDGSVLTKETLGDPHVAIEFTEPGAAVPNATACVRAGIPVVVGTTGWGAQLHELEREVHHHKGALLWAPNFSIGILLLAQLVERLSELAPERHGFSAQVVETHHAEKKDAPSGTAALLARIYANGRAEDWSPPITSIRLGYVPGRHELIIDGMHEQLRLIHDTRDRRIFAEGAVTAAEWLTSENRQGVFTLRDVLVDDRGKH